MNVKTIPYIQPSELSLAKYKTLKSFKSQKSTGNLYHLTVPIGYTNMGILCWLCYELKIALCSVYYISVV